MINKYLTYLAPFVCVLSTAQPTFALTFDLNDIGGAAAGTDAGDGFIAAANIWSNLIADPITVHLDVGFTELGAGILGSTSSNFAVETYANVRDALIQDQTSLVDQVAVNHLQVNDNLAFLSTDYQGNLSVDNDGSANNTYLSLTTANLKALGLLIDDGSTDASISFSNLFSFDFDNSDGVDSGSFDFVSVAVHEIGHALGFISGVDTIDYYSGNGDGANQAIDFNPYAIFSSLDLFRYSSESLNQGSNLLDLGVGDRGQYYSLDGGENSIAPFSTGSYNGDGQQASHWEDNLNLGLLDPTLAPGEIGNLSDNDLIALDSIGYNLTTPINQFPGAPLIEENNTPTVSLPSSLLCFLLGGYAMILFRRKSPYRHRYPLGTDYRNDRTA